MLHYCLDDVSACRVVQPVCILDVHVYVGLFHEERSTKPPIDPLLMLGPPRHRQTHINLRPTKPILIHLGEIGPKVRREGCNLLWSDIFVNHIY
jgi:hypothetical protein